jgi:hypothetical protein
MPTTNTPPEGPEADSDIVECSLRITMFPAEPIRRQPDWLAISPWLLGLAAAVLLMLATVGWDWWFAVVSRVMNR